MNKEQPAGLDILVGVPVGEEGDEPEAEEASEEPKQDQDAIIAEIRALLDKLSPAAGQLG